MRPLGAVVLGISTYRYGASIGYAPPLRYAVGDADAIRGYLEACWPEKTGAVVRRIAESEADLAALRAAFAEVAAKDSYDLFFVFLSGHGLVASPKPGFVVQPDAAGALGLATAEELDRLLSLERSPINLYHIRRP